MTPEVPRVDDDAAREVAQADDGRTSGSVSTWARPLALLLLGACMILLVDYVGRATILARGGIVDGCLRRARDIFALALLSWSALATGERVLRALRIEPETPLHALTLRFAVGFGACYAVGLLLAVAQLVSPLTLWATAGLPLLVFRREAIETLRQTRDLLPTRLALAPDAMALAALGLVYAVMALSPPTHVDELTYHLVVPRDYLRHGGVPNEFDNAFHSAPPATAMVFMFLMGMGSDFLPKLAHPLFGVLLALLCFDRMRSMWSPWVARLAVLLFAAQWSVQHAVQRANVDLLFAFYALSSLFLVLRRYGPGQTLPPTEAALSGGLLGVAVASKLQAISSVAGMEVLLLAMLALRQVRLRTVVIFHLAALALYLPTLARNLAFSLDPFVLTIASAFGSDAGFDPQEALRLALIAQWKRLFMVELTPATLLLTPLMLYRDGYFPSTNYDAFIDPFYLVTSVVCVFLLRRDRPLAGAFLYLAAYYAVWLATASLTRYAFPVLPILCLITARAFDAISSAAHPSWFFRRAFAGLVVVFAAISALSMVLESRVYLAFNLSAFVEATDREAFYQVTDSDARDSLAVARHMNERDVARDGVVDGERNRAFMVFESQGYYLDRRYYNDPFYVNLLLLQNAEKLGHDPLQWLRAQRYRYVVVDYRRVPWLRNRRRPNELLNPYPDASARLEAVLDYWSRKVKPRLSAPTSLRRLTVYEVP